jgi:hypothetical protein
MDQVKLFLDLQREKMEHEREVRERKQAIASLKEQLQEIKSKTTVKTQYARKEAAAKTSTTLRQYHQVRPFVLDTLVSPELCIRLKGGLLRA